VLVGTLCMISVMMLFRKECACVCIYLLFYLSQLLLMCVVPAMSCSMKDPTKSKYQLLLHCILIVTSVIPPELPMQTALAVNASIMTLMKMQIFCTEPFRVPIAGKVDTCIFDKTGTLTTDELVAVGAVAPSVRLDSLLQSHAAALQGLEEVKAKAKKAASDLSSAASGNSNKPAPQPTRGPAPRTAPSTTATPAPTPVQSAATAGLTPIHLSDPAMTLVLGGCHSLVMVDGKVAGDPLEVASLRAIKWELPLKGPSDTSRPKPEVSVERPQSIDTLDSGSVKLTQVKILARHHFSSKLQRMSVVVKVKGDTGGGFALVKGSPEALAKMCTDCPPDYAAVAGNLAKRGMRVIALGIRRLSSSQEIKQCCESRSFTEDSLRFAGFIAFTCRVRKDTAECVQNLLYGGMSVIMATGDAMLTAIHVAQEVGITVPTKKGILILEQTDDEFFWTDYESGGKSAIKFSRNDISVLSREYDLCVTGAVLMQARAAHPALAAQMEAFAVFARMRPDEKESVILAMKEAGRVTLMCGDGANDVGALKQSHVGVALLSGFGDLNVTRDSDGKDSKAITAGASKSKTSVASTAVTATAKGAKPVLLTAKMTDAEFKDMCGMRIPDIKTRLRLINIEPDDYPEKTDATQLASLYRETADAKAEENHLLKRAKDLKSMSVPERKKFLAEEQKAQAQKAQEDFKEEYAKLLAQGDSWAMVNAMKNCYAKTAAETKKKRGDNSFTGSAGSMAAMMDQMDDMDDLQMPMIKIGDASVASPFTSKMPSIRGCVDIIRQGRCTLVTTIQMYQILALNCLISAYSLSVLHLDGVKYGDRQMTCLGILMSVSFVTVSRAKPLDRLSEVRPLKSVFHPALFLSILGQFVLHIYTMHSLVKQGKTYLPDDYKVNMDGEFEPSIVNSIVFLVTAVQQVSVFVVNLKGPPFMGGLTENTPLLWSLVITFVGTFLCASESIPQLNSGLKLEPFPSVPFRNTVLTYLVIDVCGSMLWDRLLLFIFAFPVLKASLASTTRKEVMQVLKVVLIVCAGVYWLAVQDYTEIMAELERQEEATRLAELGLEGGGGGAASGDYADVAPPVVPGGINNMFDL
jgi:manganese-transporting P-type ATPase